MLQVMKDGRDGLLGLVDYATADDLRNAIRKLDDTEFRNPFDRWALTVDWWHKGRLESQVLRCMPAPAFTVPLSQNLYEWSRAGHLLRSNSLNIAPWCPDRLPVQGQYLVNCCLSVFW